MTYSDVDLVSIITPVFNSRYISDCVRSIQDQSYSNWELLITDDCSMDGTFVIISDLAKSDKRIKVFRLAQNSGPGAARNHSIEAATGRYIAFCDSDDYWAPDKLERQIRFMRDHDLVLSYSSYDVVAENGNYLKTVTAVPSLSYGDMLKNNYIGCLTAIYDSEKTGKVYMPKIQKRQDWALWLVILKNSKRPAMGIQDSLAYYRVTQNSISSRKLRLMQYNWRIFREVEEFSFIQSLYYMARFLIYYSQSKIT